MHCLLAPLLALGAVGMTQELTFDGTRLPAEQTHPWSYHAQEGTAVVVDGGALRVTDDGTRSGQLQFLSYPWAAEAGQPATVTAEVRVGRCSGRSGVCLLAADGVHEAAVTLYPDRVAMHNPVVERPVKLADGFHQVTLKLDGSDLQVLVDGQVTIDLPGQWTHPAYEGRNLVGFGSLSSAATSEAWWRRVTATVTYPDVTLHPGAETVVVYRQPEVYACFPSLHLLPDGTLVSSFGTRTRRSHIDNTGGSARMLSRDGGRTWAAAPADLVVPNEAARRADGHEALAGAIGWTYAPEAQRAEIEAKGWLVRAVRPGTIGYLSGYRTAVRRPDGTFLKPWTSHDPPPGGGLMSYNQAARVNLGGGRHLVAVYGIAPGDSRTAYVLRSTDDGESWALVTIAAGTPQLGFSETALGVTAEGHVLALLRTAETPQDRGYLYQSTSTDGGATWSTPHKTGLWGYPAHLLTLPDGRLVATYGYRRAPMGIRAALSYDGGRTWDQEREIVLRADGQGSGSDLGYPITQRLADGTLVTGYYFNAADNVTHIAVTRWQPPQP